MPKENATARYDEGKLYDVRFMRVVEYRGAQLLPRDRQEVLGAALNLIVEKEGADVIDAADPR